MHLQNDIHARFLRMLWTEVSWVQSGMAPTASIFSFDGLICILCGVLIRPRYYNCWRVAFSTLKVHDDTKRHDWFMITIAMCISRCQCQKWWHMRTYITAWQCRNSEWIRIFRWLIMDKYLYSTVYIQWSALLFFSPVIFHYVVVMIAAIYFLGSIAIGFNSDGMGIQEHILFF